MEFFSPQDDTNGDSHADGHGDGHGNHATVTVIMQQ